MENLNAADWKARLEKESNTIILDVRTPEEWEEGIIPNAEMLNIFEAAEFMQAIETMDSEASYFVYCRSGGRSGQACQLLSAKGRAAFNLDGGIGNWKGETVIPEL